MTKSTITREESVQAVFDLKVGYTLELADIEILKRVARMALAAMDSEPVAYTDEAELNFVNDMACMWTKGMGINEVPLYRHAQPAPVAPAVSDDIGEIRVGRLPTMNQDDYPGLGDWWVQLRIGEDSDEVLARVYGATPQEANNRAEALACRAAMLQAEPVTTANKLGNSPVIPGGVDSGKRATSRGRWSLLVLCGRAK